MGQVGYDIQGVHLPQRELQVPRTPLTYVSRHYDNIFRLQRNVLFAALLCLLVSSHRRGQWLPIVAFVLLVAKEHRQKA